MNFISKIPKTLTVALFAVIGYAVIDYITVTLYLNLFHGMNPTRQYLFIHLLWMSLSGVASATIIWIGLRKAYKNAWAIAITTGFAMLAIYPVIRVLIGMIPGYLLLLPVVWGFLVTSTRIFSHRKRTILTFCLLFILCALLWFAGNWVANWIFSLRAY